MGACGDRRIARVHERVDDQPVATVEVALVPERHPEVPQELGPEVTSDGVRVAGLQHHTCLRGLAGVGEVVREGERPSHTSVGVQFFGELEREARQIGSCG